MPTLLIPALMWIGHVVFGAIEPTIAGVIINKLRGLSPGSSSLVDDVLGVFKTSLSSVEQEQENEFKLKLQELLDGAELDRISLQGQIEVNKIAETSDSWFQDVRDLLFFGLSVSLLMSVLVEPTINYIVSFFGVHPPEVFTLSPLVIGILSGLLGIHIATKSVENRKK